MSDPFDWEPFAGDRWSPENVNDQIVGTVTKIAVQKGNQGDVPVVTVREKDTDRDQEIWPPVHLKGLLSSSNVQVGDLIAVKLIELKNTGKPSPMKVFALKVKQAEGTTAPDPEPTYEDGEEPF